MSEERSKSDTSNSELLNQAFRKDAEAHLLRFRCESCAHVNYETISCSLGYPNDYLTGEVIAVQPDLHLSFCKYFELG